MPSAEPLPSRLTSQSSGSSVSRTRICPPGLGVLVEEEPERADGARPPTRQAASRPPPPAAAAPAMRRLRLTPDGLESRSTRPFPRTVIPHLRRLGLDTSPVRFG